MRRHGGDLRAKVGEGDGGCEAGEDREADRLLLGEGGFGDDVEQPLRGIAVVGGVVSDGEPGKHEDLGVAAGVGDPCRAFPAAGLGGDGEAGARGRGEGGVPALAGGGLLDLDAERAVGPLQVERRPVAGAQLPLGLKRHRHHLLDQLAADRVKDERGAEEAVG